MTAGKLVRDKIPNEIRDSGRHVEIQHLSGEDLTIALGAKLQEEAQEAAEAIGSRDRLIKELADVTEVISALRKVNSISDDALAQVIRAKALQRGRFDDGTFLVSEVPEPIYRWRVSDVDACRRLQRRRGAPEGGSPPALLSGTPRPSIWRPAACGRPVI
jgi:predicted house-cleaning noncanonical NTP pyrophosphatase (MazG superfamily)